MPHTNNKDGAKKFKYKDNKRAPISAPSRPPKRKPEATFDDEARRDFLTGFSKRKKAKKEAAATRAEEKDRLARNELRLELRQQRKQQAAENVQAASVLYGDPLSGEEDSFVFEEPKQPKDRANDSRQDFIDEEEGVHATVLIEQVDLDQEEDEQPSTRPGRNQHMHPDRAAKTQRSDQPKMIAKLKPKVKTKANPHRSEKARPAYTSKAERKRDATKRRTKR